LLRAARSRSGGRDATNNLTVEKMPPAMRILLCAAGAIVASLLTACGSGSSTATPANIRLVNATATALTMSLNGGYDLAGIASDSVSGYESVPPGTYTVSVASVDGSLASSPQTLGIGTAQNYTTLAFARGNVVYAATITDNLAVPVAGFTTLDVANVAPDAGALDVYLVASGTTSLAGLSQRRLASLSGRRVPGPIPPPRCPILLPHCARPAKAVVPK